MSWWLPLIVHMFVLPLARRELRLLAGGVLGGELVGRPGQQLAAHEARGLELLEDLGVALARALELVDLGRRLAGHRGPHVGRLSAARARGGAQWTGRGAAVVGAPLP